MKNLLLLAAISYQILAICFQANAQDGASDPKAPVITFVQDTMDYGTIQHNADGLRLFKFMNTGKEQLLVEDVPSPCGCTTASWPKEPVKPGKGSEIKVQYATDRVGVFLKTFTVISNASDNPKIIYIKGNVLPDPSVSNIQPNPSSSATNK